jgi:hypothetical protein
MLGRHQSKLRRFRIGSQLFFSSLSFITKIMNREAGRFKHHPTDFPNVVHIAFHSAVTT